MNPSVYFKTLFWFLIFTGLASFASAKEPAAPSEIKLSVSTTEKIGKYVHFFWLDFQPDVSNNVVKVRQAFFQTTYEMTLRGSKPVSVAEEEETGKLLLYTFVNENAADDKLKSISILYSPKEQKATGFVRLADGVRAVVEGGVR